MTDETTTNQTIEPESTTTEELQEQPRGNREAKYRVRAREAEEKAEALSQQLRATRVALLQRESTGNGKLRAEAARDVLQAADDDTINGLFNDAGDVDSSKLEAFITEQRTAHPYLGQNAQLPAPGDELHPKVEPTELSPSWSESFA